MSLTKAGFMLDNRFLKFNPGPDLRFYLKNIPFFVQHMLPKYVTREIINKAALKLFLYLAFFATSPDLFSFPVH